MSVDSDIEFSPDLLREMQWLIKRSGGYVPNWLFATADAMPRRTSGLGTNDPGRQFATAAPVTTPRIVPQRDEQETDRGGDGGWIVIVYNNEHNTYLEVISILMQATACTREEAEIETWEIDHLGQSVVHHGRQEECERAAAVIRTIGIQVETKEE